jgi:hypothetical protein
MATCLDDGVLDNVAARRSWSGLVLTVRLRAERLSPWRRYLVNACPYLSWPTDMLNSPARTAPGEATYGFIVINSFPRLWAG